MKPVTTVKVRAPAKINLSLRVLGVRPDGYHEVRTVLQSIALHDTLTFERVRGPFRIECNDPSCPTDRSNLVWGAAELVWRAGGRRGRPVNTLITLTKRIPMQAGLGGGSSDAAAAIRGLSALWRIKLTPERQRELAAKLGVDVPFFLEGGRALGLERGDVMFQLFDAPAAWVALVIPSFGVSARQAYSWWDERARRALPASSNDLQAAVSEHHPQIAAMVRSLARHGASQASMSGSGSAVFGLFEQRSRAQATARALDGSGYRSYVTRTVKHSRYCAATRARR